VSAALLSVGGVRWVRTAVGSLGPVQTAAELREHYEIERELADRLRNAVTREERRRLYGEVYRELHERLAHHPLVLQTQDALAQSVAAAPQVRLLRTFVSSKSDFCEIGAGDSAVARALAPYVRSSLALDVTDAFLTGPNTDGNFAFRVFDGFDPGLAPGSVDVAYSRDVAEHLHPDDLIEQTAAIARMLRPGGIYLCVSPNRLSGPHDVSRRFDDFPTGLHLREYTASELAVAMRRSGFSDTKVVVSWAGRRLSPLLPVWIARWFEAVVAHLPRRARRSVGELLGAVKVVAIR
jgi:SAM-dependent methyltransferase